MNKEAKEQEQEINNGITYGMTLPISSVHDMLDILVKSNQSNVVQGKDKDSLTIWGKHGIGKTKGIEAYCKANNHAFAYLPLGQIEEFGDIIGMPSTENGETVYSPPPFVPKEPLKEGQQGIFLIDDFNRASIRIVKGMMQLVQNYETVGWKLSDNWHIVMTANPEGVDYDITSVDFAFLTRSTHVTMEFSIIDWVKWLETKGYSADLIGYVKSYGLEIDKFINAGKMTTPRSYTAFFDKYDTLMKGNKIEDNKIGIVKSLAMGKLDPEAADHFISFMREQLITVPNVKNFLNNAWEETKLHLSKYFTDHTSSAFMANIVLERLKQYCFVELDHKLEDNQLENLKNILLYKNIPVDLRLKLRDKFVKYDKYYSPVVMNPEIQKIS